ncbi:MULTISPECIES: hypothetical protein [unclassified Mesorhizobium]|uniref:hypothetical protein n=1 Tax=unclassified Mesorhizobium TaxID=325217 RepID=UPI0033394E6A
MAAAENVAAPAGPGVDVRKAGRLVDIIGVCRVLAQFDPVEPKRLLDPRFVRLLKLLKRLDRPRLLVIVDDLVMNIA